MFLIPEDIARYIDYSSVSKDECFKLTHDEYESGNIDRVVKYIEEKLKHNLLEELIKFAFAKRSEAMKAPVGLSSDRTVLRQQDGGAAPRQVRVC